MLALLGRLAFAGCDVDAHDLVADMGAVVSAAGGCSFVVETRPSPSLFSWGGAKLPYAVEPDLTLELRWRRLTERGSAALEIVLPGVYLLVRNGEVGWWENDARFTAEGYTPFPVDTSRAHAVRIEQRGAELRAWIDGVEIPAFTLAAEPAPGRLSIGLKGGAGDRARVWVSDVRLQQPSGDVPSTARR